ncbi:MAG: hypothetical protein MHPSP_004284, partial [Paramarteilia canceri]
IKLIENCLKSPLNCFIETLSISEKNNCFKLWTSLAKAEREKYGNIAFVKSKTNLTKYLPTMLRSQSEEVKCQDLKEKSKKMLIKYFGLSKKPPSPFYQFFSDRKNISLNQNLSISEARRMWMSLEKEEQNKYREQFAKQFNQYKKSKNSEICRLKKMFSIQDSD